MDANDEKLIRNGLSGARWVALGALVQKVVSVLLNQISMRLVDAGALGVARTKLDLLLSALLVCREGFRLALVREKMGEAEQIGLALVPSLLGSLFAATLAVSADETPFRLFCLAAFLEVSTEPLHSLSLVRMIAAPRAFADAIGALFSGVALALLLTKTRTDHLVALALSRVAHSVGVCLGRIMGWPRGSRVLLTVPAVPSRALLRTSFWLCAQAALKQALSDCDKVALSVAASSSVSGIYALANNYGSLIARVTLQPTEEAARLIFSTMKRRGSLDSQGRAVLSGLLKAAVYFGLFFACLGSFYAPIATRLLLRRGGQGEQETHLLGRALSAFCLLIPCLALNGVSEAFVQATGDASSLRRLATVHVVSALAFLATAVLVVDDASSLILVNASATLLRVVLVFTLVDRRLLRSNFLPHHISLVAFAVVAALASTATAAATTTGDERKDNLFAAVSFGALLASILVLVSYLTERHFVADLTLRLKTHKKGD